MDRLQNQTTGRLLLVVIWTLLAAGSALAQSRDAVFDHDGTRFPLVGRHERIDCGECHVGGVFRGTPTRCAICHDGSGRYADTSRGIRHIRTTNECDDCHLLNAWQPSRVDHDSVIGSCAVCHDGRTASGKPNGHPRSSANCDDCHRTTTWMGARFAHIGVSDNCFRCHNGTEATGKPPGHIQSSNVCEQCHRTTTWFDIRFDHDEVTGACSSCHNGQLATGKPSGHFQTTEDCDRCHRTNSWGGTFFSHASPDYPGDHAGNPDCDECHRANSQVVNWSSPGYQPDCAGCHARDYETGPHKKHENPDVKYTVGELRDCAGSCHIYTDSSLTRIKDRRNGEHRARDGDFD